ncbi:MAG: Flp family type IVb pilin [Desulfuromonadales bacterium]|nr:Flp family type IVb pilin [Desulfuromonadales bacterium]
MHVKLPEKFQGFLRDEQAATAVEYAIMLVLVIVVVYVAVGFLGKETEKSFNKFVTTFNP